MPIHQRTPGPKPTMSARLSSSTTVEHPVHGVRLNPANPPGDVPPVRWTQFIDDCGRFLDQGWAQRCAALGWGPLDLFGCDRERPFGRIDHQGLLWLLDGNKIVELHRDKAIIQTKTGARQTYRRRPVEVGRIVLAWELAS